MVTVHEYDDADSGSVYDFSQCFDEIKDGDVLIATSDQVIGFLYKAWPCAVTEHVGHFHDFDRQLLEKEPTYKESYSTAIVEAEKRGWNTR